VLINLQSNAIKFTQKGEVKTIVEIVSNDKHEKFLKISVNDTGIGIPEQDHCKLFKLFGFVKDNQKMNINGIGLGLMISQ
jgi:signal transduction histidine kinase